MIIDIFFQIKAIKVQTRNKQFLGTKFIETG